MSEYASQRRGQDLQRRVLEVVVSPNLRNNAVPSIASIRAGFLISRHIDFRSARVEVEGGGEGLHCKRWLMEIRWRSRQEGRWSRGCRVQKLGERTGGDERAGLYALCDDALTLFPA